MGMNLERRHSESYLGGNPFPFTSDKEDDGQATVALVRLDQEWLDRRLDQVIACPLYTSKRSYLFSGLVKCPICHLNHYGMANVTNIKSYKHCNLRLTENCVSSIRGDKLERAVMLSIAKIISNQDLLMQSIKQSNMNSGIEKDRIETEQQVLEMQKEKIEQKKSRILKFLFNGTVTEDETTKPLAEIRKDLDDIEKRMIANQFLMKSLNVCLLYTSRCV